MATREAITSALESCFDSMAELGAGLDAEQWGTPSLCPGWDTTGVYLHLAAIEHMLSGWKPESLETPLPFGLAGEYLAQHQGDSGAEVLAAFNALNAGRRRELTEMSDAAFAQECSTPVGPSTYQRFMMIRVFDFWVHEQDVRRPLDLPGHADGIAAEIAIDEIQGSMGYIAGKKIGLADGQSLQFSLTGPVERTINVAVAGRAAVVEELHDPTAQMSVDSTTFALLACGRIDPQGAIDSGAISWTGDAGVGDRAARNLAFTM